MPEENRVTLTIADHSGAYEVLSDGTLRVLWVAPQPEPEPLVKGDE